ncbi:O-antigen ligase-related protein [Rhodopirellula maiorica SM1]|uniref:O-antigen ligase-related protein n=1 Tax=Rhodopirellula maiorica SM1 TaxID=1265738 RepID=M5RAK3_9BACT|nr:O-antigen ligase family protein [Rhodopirellula maiorica]EMI16528.1 O-antigen ligase-related protein [Rhodopirellula maiorica SM1]
MMTKRIHFTLCLIFAVIQFGMLVANWTWYPVPKLGWITEGWVPPASLFVVIAVVACLLAFSRRSPTWSVSAYLLASYSVPRYQPECEWMLRHFVPEIVTLFAVIFFWIQRDPSDSSSCVSECCENSRFQHLAATIGQWWMAVFAVYVLGLSIACRLITPDSNWFGDLKHSPLRMLAGLTMCYLGITVSRRIAMTQLTTVLAVVVIVRLLWTFQLQEDGDVAFLLVALIPLCAASALQCRGTIFRSFWGLTTVAAIAAVVATANRGGAIGLVIACSTLIACAGRRAVGLAAIFLITSVVCFLLVPGFDGASLKERMDSVIQHREQDPNVLSRLVLWEAATQSLDGQRLWWGQGPGQGPAAISRERGSVRLVAVHNTFLAIILELGLVGVILCVGPLLLGMVCVCQRWRSCRSLGKWIASSAKLASVMGMLGCGIAISRHDDGLMFFLVGCLIGGPGPNHIKAVRLDAVSACEEQPVKFTEP